MIIENSSAKRNRSFIFSILALAVVGGVAALWLRNPQLFPAKSAVAPSGDQLELDERCAMYRVSIEKKIGEQRFYAKRARTSANYTLKRIFYSPRTQSCLYVAMTTVFKSAEIEAIILNLANASDHETIHSAWLYWGTDEFAAEKGRFEHVVAQYQRVEVTEAP